MDIFEHSYYRLNKRFLLLIGQWPYQDSVNRLWHAIFIVTMVSSLILVQITLLFTNGSVDTIFEIIPPITAAAVVLSKFFMLYIYRSNVKNLLERVIDDWKLWKNKEEMDIMHEFGKEGKFLSFVYATYIYMSMTLFLVLPFAPRIMDKVSPLNESRRLMPIFNGEYFIDEDEHFFLIYLHMSIVIVTAITVLITSDVLFLIFNSHICGVFTALGFHLENFLHVQTYSKRTCFESIVFSIKSHQRALEFAELIESSYSIPLFVQVSMSLMCMSISLFQIVMVAEKPAEMFRYIAFTGAQLAHIFCMCYPGQRMIDYSTQIRIKAYSGLWYEAPIEIHGLVLLIMRRSLEPCCLTAGKIFVFCLESFSTIVQTSTSYFMVIASVH